MTRASTAIRICFGAILAQLPILSANAAAPQSVEQFYKGRVVTMYIGLAAGGGYDLYGRLVGRHIARHIPGHPTIVPVNMEGAGGLKFMNWLYSVAPKDGTAIGIVNHGTPFLPLVSNQGFARFDSRKFTWIGSANDEVSVCVSWKRTGITTFDHLQRKELIVGSTGPGADEFMFPKLLVGVFGARIRTIAGYAGANDINFAMERGEVDGRCGWTWSSVITTRQRWLDDKSINILLQFALRKHPNLPGVPLIMDLAKDDEERQVLRLAMLGAPFGRPFLAPPGVPADRAAALRQAFDATMQDPAFLEEARRARVEILPVPAATLDALLVEAYATPPHILERARAVMN